MRIKTAFITWILTNVVSLLLSLAYFDSESATGNFLAVCVLSLIFTTPVHYLMWHFINQFARKSKYGHFIENILLTISYLVLSTASFFLIRLFLSSSKKLILTTAVTYAIIGAVVWGFSIFNYNNGEIRADENEFK